MFKKRHQEPEVEAAKDKHPLVASCIFIYVCDKNLTAQFKLFSVSPPHTLSLFIISNICFFLVFVSVVERIETLPVVRAPLVAGALKHKNILALVLVHAAACESNSEHKL